MHKKYTQLTHLCGCSLVNQVLDGIEHLRGLTTSLLSLHGDYIWPISARRGL